MKPDPHKKKKSAQYQKKHPELRAEKQKGKPSTQVPSQVRPSEAGPSQSKAPDVETEIDSESEESQTPSFSRRKVESNWNRYSASLETLNQLEAPAENFLSLVESTANVAAQFTHLDLLARQPSVEVESVDALKMDVDTIAALVHSLPLCRRLGVDDTTLHPELACDPELPLPSVAAVVPAPAPAPMPTPLSTAPKPSAPAIVYLEAPAAQPTTPAPPPPAATAGVEKLEEDLDALLEL